MSVHPWTDLPALMARLDACLAAAVPHARARFGIGPGADPYPGLYIGDELVDTLVTQSVDRQPLGDTAASDWPELRPAGGCETLDPFETAVVILAVAPEIDLKYERIYGYLQDDVAARRPHVALALDLFCSDLSTRLAARDRFSPDATLRSQRIVTLGGNDDGPLLGRPIRLDPQLIRHLVGGTGLDERVAAQCTVLVPDSHDVPIPLENSDRARLHEWVGRARGGRPVRAVLAGADLPVLADIARHVAAGLEMPMLRLNDADGSTDFASVLAAESRLLEYAVHVELATDSLPRALLHELDSAGQLVLITTNRPAVEFEGRGFDVLEIGAPGASTRREWWQRFAPAADDSDLDRLAARYGLTGSQIELAARAAQFRASGAGGPVGFDDYAATARRQAAHRLDALASRVPIMATWDDLVLAEPATAALHELCDRVTHRHTVLHQVGRSAA